MKDELSNTCNRCGRITHNVDLYSDTFTCDACGSTLPNKHFTGHGLGRKIDGTADNIQAKMDEVKVGISDIPKKTAELIMKKDNRMKVIIERIIVSLVVSLIIALGQYFVRKTDLFSNFIDWIKNL